MSNLTRFDRNKSIQKPTRHPTRPQTPEPPGRLEMVNRIQSIDRYEYIDSSLISKYLKSITILVLFVVLSLWGLIGQINSIWGK